MAFLLSLNLQVLIFIIQIYQTFISPLFGLHCRFNPTCSQYGIEVLYRFGILKGSYLMIQRLLKCHPLYSDRDNAVSQKLFNNREKQ